MSSTADARSYTVTGMTCQHCVASVTEEVGELDGVDAVDVELASGRLVVRGPAAASEDEIRAAVRAAGYEVES